jgi:hypothetical protein
MLFGKQKWTSQPQFATGIDWANPLTRKLIFAAIGGNPFNLVNQARGAPTGAVSTTVGKQGKSFTTAAGGSVNALTFANGAPAVFTEATYGSVFQTIGSSTPYFLIERGTTTDHIFSFTNGTNYPTIWYSATGFATFSTGAVNGEWNIASISTPPSGGTLGSSCVAWMNGKALGIQGAGNGSFDATPSPDVTLNGDPNTASHNFPGSQSLAVIWDRVLTAAEHAAFNANPW